MTNWVLQDCIWTTTRTAIARTLTLSIYELIQTHTDTRTRTHAHTRARTDTHTHPQTQTQTRSRCRMWIEKETLNGKQESFIVFHRGSSGHESNLFMNTALSIISGLIQENIR